MKTTSCVLMIVFVFAILAVTACISPAPPPSADQPTPALKTVRVGYAPLISNAPFFIAKEEGYFARQGIDAELIKIQTGAEMIPVLVNGDIAAGGVGVTASLINSAGMGGRVRIVADKGRAIPNQSCAIMGLMVRRDLVSSGAVTTASDLKGKKIMSTSEDYRLYRILSQGNLTVEDVEVVKMDFASGVVALQNGAVDAADLGEPFITRALDSNAAVMFIPIEEYAPDYPTPLLYGTAFLDKDPELGRRFMVAYLEGVRQYNLGKTERNIAILSNYTQLDRDLLMRSCWVQIAGDGYLPPRPVREYIDWMYANKMIASTVENDQLFDMSYAEYANGILANTTPDSSRVL